MKRTPKPITGEVEWSESPEGDEFFSALGRVVRGRRANEWCFFPRQVFTPDIPVGWFGFSGPFKSSGAAIVDATTRLVDGDHPLISVRFQAAQDEERVPS
jgi:hypothetical protein